LRYAEAIEANDSARLYAMMTQASRQEYGEKGTKQLLTDAQAERKSRAVALRAGPLRVDAEATLRFSDGESARLKLEGGGFWVESTLALPARPATPRAALAVLRTALQRQSYQTLLRVLSEEKRDSVERDRNALLAGLANADAAQVTIQGDKAEAELVSGHKISLIREEGVWKVQSLK
jgi:hypothetical protein